MRTRTRALIGARNLKQVVMGMTIGLMVPLALTSCGGGGGTDLTQTNFFVAPLGTQSLSETEVDEIIARAVQASISRNVQSTIAVTDRVGNVLAVYQMNNSAINTTITSGLAGANGSGLDGITVPSTLAAVAKAITGAYLSSTGNAFTTRTASQIVQEFFQPGEAAPRVEGQPSGPLYGVQFSQLPCSDLNVWLSQSETIGPKRSPLGLSADPGGFPIYENGRVVGGIGVISSANAGVNGVYSLDRNIQDTETDWDEEIAFAALPERFRAPNQIRGNRITANGQTFQFSNSTPPTAGLADLTINGSYLALPGYKTSPDPISGTSYGAAPSGYVPSTNSAFNGLNAFTLIANPADSTAVRFPARASTLGNSEDLTLAEVQNALVKGLEVANLARGQIRNPLGSRAEVTISIVDLDGSILGLIRSSDAPIFGTDVSVQKARSALTFSSAEALTDFNSIDGGAHASFANAMNVFFSERPSGVLDGTAAFSARAIGNVHRPYFPDAEVGRPEGPLSSPIASWSPFNVGFQLNIVESKVFATFNTPARTVVGGDPFAPDPTHTCVDNINIPVDRHNRFANGMQIFPGGFPIYKGDTLVGAIGVSGDGVDQDDMIGYLGILRGAAAIGSSMRPFPQTLLRSDGLSNSNVRLKYVQCPQAPFDANIQQNVCPAP